jgi:MFS-type transporter involved in bile tolerance (Atg22 family)
MAERDRAYHRRIRAWTLYELGSSAFAACILAGVLPEYYRQVAASGLSGSGAAFARWSTSLGLSILFGALAAAALGTLSDIARRKKLLLALFVGLGVICTGLLVLVESGDWLLASMLLALGQLGFGGSSVFYDALLPHVARPVARDLVSGRGRARGFLGGGVLLAACLLLLRLLPGTWGPRLGFASVALWWALCSIPVLAAVREPRALAARPEGAGLLAASLRRLGRTLRELRGRRELFRYLLSYLLYAGGLGALAAAGTAQAAELGLGGVRWILILLLALFAGVPFSWIFGRLPQPEDEAPESRGARQRPVLLAFVLANLALLPALGILGTRFLPRGWTGATPPPYVAGPGYAGQGRLSAEDPALVYFGSWESERVDALTLNARADRMYRAGQRAGDRAELRYFGQAVVLTHAAGPDFGIWHVEMDGRPLAGPDGRPLLLNCYSPAARWELDFRLQAASPGLHTLALSNYGEKDTRSAGTRLALGALRVLEPHRLSSLPLILGLILALESACLGLAFLLGRPLLSGLAARMSTPGSLALALGVYAAIAVCGFFLDSVLDFGCLALLAACALAGSRTLGRSLFAGLIPAPRSGEFFSLLGAIGKLAVLLGWLAFTAAAALLGARRPAAGLAVLFLAALALLLRVRVAEGRAAARAEEEALKAAPRDAKPAVGIGRPRRGTRRA